MPDVPKIDIRPDLWEIVQGILKKHVPLCEVWAFGSRAKWNAKEYSDLDLAIITDRPLSLDVSASLSDDFSESDLPWRVDVVDWATTSESFRKIIEHDKVVVHEGKKRGEGMSEWEEKRFGCIVRFVSDKSQAKDTGIETYISTENMLPNFGGISAASTLPLSGSITRFKAGDTLFSNIRTYFKKVWQAKFDGCCSNDVLVFRPVNTGRLLPDYLYQVCRWEKFTELSIRTSKGAKMPRGDKDALIDFKFWLPPLTEQRAIAHILGTLDDKIELNRKQNETLEAMAQALFKSWFVDFEPVKAKIAAKQEGRDPLRAAMIAISGKPDVELDALPPEQYAQLAATAALFPDEMEESELGEIPRGWEINCISQFGDVVCGKTPSKANPEYFGDGIPFIKIPDMHNSVYVVSPSERLTALGAASQAKKTIPSGSICVSCIATVGKVVITHEPSQTNQQINSIVPKTPQFTAYLYFQMKKKEKEFHDLASGGSATLNMNTSTFSKVSVLAPTFDALERFNALVEPLFSEILLRQKTSATLSEMRDTLLPKLLSGELSVAPIDTEPCS